MSQLMFTRNDEWLKIEEEAAGTTYAVMNVARFFSERDTLVQKKKRDATPRLDFCKKFH